MKPKGVQSQFFVLLDPWFDCMPLAKRRIRVGKLRHGSWPNGMRSHWSKAQSVPICRHAKNNK